MKKLIIPAVLLLFMSGLSSCEELLDCKVCRFNTYEDNVLINSVNETEYCGGELLTILATPEEVVGATVYKWECE